MRDDVTVLVVDDSPGNLLAMEATLSSVPCRVITASSGSEALREVTRPDLAVVLLDVLMPHMDGFETARLIRQFEAARHLPIIFLTAGSNDTRFIYRGYTLGAIDYLFKPIDPDLVRAKVGAFVDLFRKQESLRKREEALRIAVERRAREALRENEAEYVGTFEEAPVGIAHVGVDEHWRRANARLSSLLGYTADELHALKLTDVVHPDDAHDVAWAFRRVVALEPTHRTEKRFVGKSGRIVWVNLTMSALGDGTGPARKVIVVLEDIGDQKFLAQTTQVLLSSLDLRRNLERVVDLAVPAMADSCAVRVGTDPIVFAQAGESNLEEHLSQPLETSRRTALANGTLYVVPLRVHGRSLGAMAFAWSRATYETVAEDVAQRVSLAIENARLYEEAQHAISARDEFLSIASHELRTPLTPLQLQLQRLLGRRKSGPITEERLRQMLERSERQVQRLAQLVDNLLDVSRIRSGQLKLQPESFDLGEAVKDVALRFSEQLTRARCALDIVEDGHALGRWDRLRVEQIVTNLLVNAVKYGSGKPIFVRVETSGDNARLTIRDHGIGIPAARLPHIFERFERAVSSRAYGGLGLGLYITQQIVDAHGGSIRVTSEEGVGSSFVVELPMNELHMAAQEARA